MVDTLKHGFCADVNYSLVTYLFLVAILEPSETSGNTHSFIIVKKNSCKVGLVKGPFNNHNWFGGRGPKCTNNTKLM